MGLAVSALGGLALKPDDLQASHRYAPAPRRLQALLAKEIAQAEAWPPEIRRMYRENPTWWAPRIHFEPALLGHDVPASTVAKYMKRSPKPPSLTLAITADVFWGMDSTRLHYNTLQIGDSGEQDRRS